MNMITIGIYDSGCGGFTVLREILKKFSSDKIIYYSDSGNNPWGNKSKSELKNRLENIGSYFDEKKVTNIITGCNTTVSIFKDELTTIFQKPIQTLFNNTQHHYTKDEYSILSTENSSKNKLFTNFLNTTKKIEEIACPGLANLIEKNELNSASELLKDKIKITSYSSVILGCTHYPLILEKVIKEFPLKNFINPASFLSPNSINIKKKINNNSIEFFTSGSTETFKKQINSYLKMDQFILNNIEIKLTKEFSNSSSG